MTKCLPSNDMCAVCENKSIFQCIKFLIKIYTANIFKLGPREVIGNFIEVIYQGHESELAIMK